MFKHIFKIILLISFLLAGYNAWAERTVSVQKNTTACFSIDKDYGQSQDIENHQSKLPYSLDALKETESEVICLPNSKNFKSLLQANILLHNSTSFVLGNYYILSHFDAFKPESINYYIFGLHKIII